MQTSWRPVLLGVYAAEQTADLGLTALNLRRARRAFWAPEGLEGLLDPAVAERSRSYAMATGWVSPWRGLASTAWATLLLCSGVLPWLDAALRASVGREAHRFILFLVPVTAGLAIADLPFAACRLFGVERRFGFWRAGPARFLRDRLRAWRARPASRRRTSWWWP
jgi:hypothetical protein